MPALSDWIGATDRTGPEPRVVIIGAGFGGLAACRALAKKPVQVLVLDRHNYHCFSPFLYQVAAGGIEPDAIAQPARRILSRHKNVSFAMIEVAGIDLDARRVLTAEGNIPYDYLIIAAGTTTNFFGLDSAARYGHGVKDLAEAVKLRNQILRAFELAAREKDGQRQAELLTFVIVGGGATGIEFAGALAELLKSVHKKDYPGIDLKSRVVLLEAGPSILSVFHPSLRAAAERVLRRKGVEVMLGARVKDVAPNEVTLADGTTIRSETLVWTAGVMGQAIPMTPEVKIGAGNRLRVEPNLQLPGFPEAYVVGDLCYLEDERNPGGALPMVAPVAIQGGTVAARNILRQLKGQPPRPFHYHDRGMMSTVGRGSGLAEVGPLKLRGFLAWLIWLSLHLLWLIGYRNKLVVLLGWSWDYLFFDTAVRLITAEEAAISQKPVSKS